MPKRSRTLLFLENCRSSTLAHLSWVVRTPIKLRVRFMSTGVEDWTIANNLASMSRRKPGRERRKRKEKNPQGKFTKKDLPEYAKVCPIFHHHHLHSHTSLPHGPHPVQTPYQQTITSCCCCCCNRGHPTRSTLQTRMSPPATYYLAI